MTLAFHPLANLFPLIEGADFDRLVDDVRENGVLEPIILLDGMILDGRNRYRAALAAGVFDADHDVHLFDGEDPLGWVLSKNLHRRHLSESQRAMVAARIANLRQGRPSQSQITPTPDPSPQEGGESENPANLPDLSGVKQHDAAELLHVSERSLRTARQVQASGATELVEAVERGELKVSAAAEVAKLPVSEQLEILRGANPKAFAKVAKERLGQINGARAIMADRREPDDSLDYFPTPPWATRALVETIGLPLTGRRVWDPACGEGHMSGVLLDYTPHVLATDIFDYSLDGRSPPGWDRTVDFLGPLAPDAKADWIITNPPFSDGSTDRTLEFALKALSIAEDGVALFVRQQWLEGGERYRRLFSILPPTLIAQFSERVNLCKGRWEPDGSTATAYCWLVWQRGWLQGPPPGGLVGFRWIKPGQRAVHTKPDDIARFTAHPVLAPASPTEQNSPDQASQRASIALAASQESSASGGAIRDSATAPGPQAARGEGASTPVAATRHTRETAEPILRARYESEGGAVLAAELGVPLGTIRTWAFHFKLTSKQRIADMARARNARAQHDHQSQLDKGAGNGPA